MEKGANYEVFLNYRVTDSLELVDPLYQRMTEVGIRVFRDDDELSMGEEIGPAALEAIQNSKIYIPIFSKNYASNPWCLRELAYTVDLVSKSDEKKVILPIFYDVEPSDVGIQTELYDKGLLKLARKFDSDLTGQWRKALIKAASIKGWVWDGNPKSLQRQVNLVVEEVLKRLNLNLFVHVGDIVVGIDDQVKALIKMLDLGGDSVHFLGIHGMGGIGKTVLAKVVFNHQASHFDGFSFLENIREFSQRAGGLLTCQKKLLHEITGLAPSVHSVDEGKMFIKKTLSNRKVLLILDDIDCREQLDALAGDRDWFGFGSRIIITTRNIGVLHLACSISTYEVRKLEADEAFNLFNMHAFGRGYPPEDWYTLSREVVSVLGGLPYALMVVGRSLYGKKKTLWVEALQKLKTVPPALVHQKLKISYEALDDKNKEIFLDIACFFINKNVTDAIYMWDDCGFFPRVGLDVLVNMSLIKITHDHTVWVHDQLRDLGREIVRCENFIDPGRRSRVWHHEEALVLIREKRKKLESVEALSLAGDTSRSIITNKEFASLPNLRFLELEGAILDGNFKDLLSELRYLSWCFCPEEFKATGLDLRNLVVLNLSEGHIRDDWGGWRHIKAMKLKVLDLTSCRGITKMPDLSGFLFLERLILCNCLKLGKMDTSIVKLKCLTYLNLKGCISLQGDLEGIERLVNLEYLCLDGCSEITELPSELGDLKSLLVLDMSHTGIQVLPDSLGKLKKLKVISSKKDKLSLLSAEGPKRPRDELSDKLEGVNPNRKGRFSFLTALKLPKCSDKYIRTIKTGILELVNLLTLDLEDCSKLQRLPKLPKSLKHLKLPQFSWYGSKIPDLIKEAGSLLSEDLLLDANVVLTSLKWIRKLINQWNLESRPADILAPSIKLSSLHWLNMQLSLLRLQSLSWLSSFLSVLAFEDRCSIDMRSYISIFKNSSCLWIYQCDHEEIKLYELEGLKKLTLENCQPLQRVSNLSIWKNLKILSLIQCPKLVELQNLGGFQSLERLYVKLCQSIERLSGLSNLRKLNILIIEECSALRDVEGLDELDSLSFLKIWNCSTLKHLTNVSNSIIPDGCEVIILKCGGLRDFGDIDHGLPYKHYREVVLGTADRDSGLDLAKRPGKMSDMELQASVNLEERMKKMEDEARERPAYVETSDRNYYAIAAVQNVIGIDDRAKQITDLLEMEVNDEVRIIGINGTNGIGKTTLAKAVYDRISSCFDSCSFLIEVEETTQNSHGIQFLQNKLIHDILERDCEDLSLDERIDDFLDIFREMKVLIVVDDVEKPSNLHAIVGEQVLWFGPGSRIIVTSKNSGILKGYDPEKACNYMVSELDEGQAFEIFCKHAFRIQSSIPDYDGLSNRIVNATEKLPLAVEVVSSFLRGKSIQEWEKMEKSIKARMVNSEKTSVGLEEILDICYNELNRQQKDIFLDIASFISGVDARIASYMWPDCCPSSGCILMPLAKIGENNELQMHRLLRCLGKRILNQERSGDPIGRKFYIQEKGIENVEARGSCILTAASFASMPAISFLKLDDAKVSGDFAGAFPRLRWLSWHSCPPEFDAINFVLRELVILDLSGSKVTEDWGGWTEIKMEKLKVVNLTGCSDLLITPDFSDYKDLEILILERCSRLVKLDPSIGHLKRLVSLNLKFCSQLNGLPVELGCTTALKELFIDGTSVRQIPISIGNLKQLKILSGLKCFPLTHLPKSICYLAALSELSLDGAKISELPSSLGKLLKLRHLSLRDCRYLEKLPYSIGEMESLEELDISATCISELPDSLRNLKSLRVLRMDSSFIRALPGEIGNLTKLEELHASWCRSLKGAISGDIEGLHHLRSLTLGHSSISRLPPDITSIPSLHTLDLIQCDEIEELPKLPPSLIRLRVSSKRMKAIPPLENLKKLEELCLSDGDLKARRPPSAIEEIKGLERLKALKKLDILNCKIQNLKGIGQLTSLRSLILSDCDYLDCSPDLSNLKSLEVLEIRRCKMIHQIEGLEKLTSLEKLNISECPAENSVHVQDAWKDVRARLKGKLCTS